MYPARHHNAWSYFQILLHLQRHHLPSLLLFSSSDAQVGGGTVVCSPTGLPWSPSCSPSTQFSSATMILLPTAKPLEHGAYPSSTYIALDHFLVTVEEANHNHLPLDPTAASVAIETTGIADGEGMWEEGSSGSSTDTLKEWFAHKELQALENQ